MKKTKSFQCSVFSVLLGLTCLALPALSQQTDSSANPEKSHLFRNSRGTSLYELNAYNSSGSTLYLQLYDSYTAAKPGTDTFAINESPNSDESFSLTTADATWTTGTRLKVTDPAGMSFLSTNRSYWLITNRNSSYFLADSLADALAGRKTSSYSGDQFWGAVAVQVNKPTLPPIQVPTKSTACLSFQGRRFSDGIFAAFSTTDTNYTAASAVGLFDGNYR